MSSVVAAAVVTAFSGAGSATVSAAALESQASLSLTGGAGAQLVAPSPARVGAHSSAAAKPGAKASRVRELTGRRSASSKSFEMSDGTTQVVMSAEPVHYRDSKGKWQDIDTRVSAGSGDDAFAAAKNAFGVRFGRSSDRLMRFEADGVSVSVGAAGDERPVKAQASGSSVTFADVFGSADVRYTVRPSGVKEDVLLASAADGAGPFVFELHTKGMSAKALPGGAVGLFTEGDKERPSYVLPAPVMTDSAAGRGAAPATGKVTQTLKQDGDVLTVTLTPDAAWLTAPERVFPVMVDPSITVAPAPAAAQDTYLSEVNPGNTYGGLDQMSVGVNGSAKRYRGLVRFDTSMIPAGTTIRSADLNMHYANTFSSDTTATPLQALAATKAWSEDTATWTDMNAAFNPAQGYNRVVVDNADGLSTSSTGTWEESANANAVGGSQAVATSGTTADTFTWTPRVPGDGDYQVETHFVPSATQGTPTYVVTGDAASSASVGVNQTTGATTGVWAQVAASQHFSADPAASALVKVTRQAGTTATAPAADAVRLTEYSRQVMPVSGRDAWHSYAVGSFVQGWVDNPASNFGFMLKAVDESATAAAGGATYQTSEDAYGGETVVRPNLVITYGEPGVELNAPTSIHASGPELSWTKYLDPTPADGDNVAEYQIFRGCRVLPAAACTAPSGDWFAGSGAQLVGTVPADVTSWTDESATASTATEGATYVYWVVVRTADDVQSGRDGRASSNAMVVTTPREGRAVKVFTGDVSDTTLSSTQNGTVLSRPDGTASNAKYWVKVGNSSSTYGNTRALFEFDTLSIKQAVKVTDARVELWKGGGAGSGTPSYDMYALTRDFVEDQATWDSATTTIKWTTKGGDMEGAALASVTTDTDPTRLTFASAALTAKVQAWVNNLGDNHGFLLKTRDETLSQQTINIVNGEAPDRLLHPRLVVEHLEKNDTQTIEADQVPERFVPGTIITTPVTVTNTTSTAWPAGLQLSYRWTEPGSGTDITTSGERNYVPLGRALNPGESVKVSLPIRTPIQSDTGAKRLAYDFYLDLWTGSDWFSATTPLSSSTTRPTQGCTMVKTGLLCVDRYVEDPTSNSLGLEKFLTYTGESTGGGGQLLANLWNGNTVWSYNALSNPSIGPSSFVRLTYNSSDVTDSGAGYGFSLQPATLTRLGSTLSVPSGGSTNNLMTFIDGDGTTHTYKLIDATKTQPVLRYTRPAGVGLDLSRDTAGDADHQWALTRPDGTRFYFNKDTGRPASVVDRNGNTLTYGYDTSGRLTSVRDAGGRTTLTLGYDTAGLKWVRDLSGRALKFTYNASHQLTTLQDGGSFDAATGAYATGALVKTFQLGYTDTSTNGNAKLNAVKDPMGSSTSVEYFTSTENSAFANWPKKYTDRRANLTTFVYSDPDGSAAKDIVAEVTDVNGSTPSVTTYRSDGYGRTTSIKDANANATGSADVTTMGWDSDHNVTRLAEPNGAVSTWEYDPGTGYPLKVRDAMTVKKNGTGVVLTYDKLTGAPGTPTVLKTKTSAAKLVTTFGYDTKGNLLTVRDGNSNGPTYTYNTNGTVATAKDARGGTTTYAGYDANGYPQSITDAVASKTDFVYDVRGNVMQVKDALAQVTTAEYDAFGRPTKVTTPHDGTTTRTTQTDYDLNDRVIKQTSPNGAQTVATYNAGDQVEKSTVPDNNLTGRAATYAYDPLGRLVSETAPNGVATPTAGDFTTSYTYDRLGQVLTMQAPFTDSDGTAKTVTTSYSYDQVGNVVKVVDPNKNATPDASDFTTKKVYDLNGQVTASTDAAGYTTKTEYNDDGQVTAQIDQLGNRTTTTYDKAGQPTGTSLNRTAIGSSTPQVLKTTATYDAAGNITRVTRPSNQVSETVYDAANRPIQRKGAADGSNTPSTYTTYDEVGRIKAQSDPTYATTQAGASAWTNYTYYPSGDIKTATDPWSIVTSYGYNSLGQQTSRALKANGFTATRSQSWTFYPDGSLASRSDTAAAQPTTIMDNANTWQVATTGTWTTVAGGTNTQGANYLTHAAAAAGTTGAADSITWKIDPDTSSQFEVWVSCPVRTDATTAATYTINHAGGAVTKTIDQKACTSANSWVSLGTYTFTGNTNRSVVLKPSTTGVVVADAVRIVDMGAAKARSFTNTYDANGSPTQVKDTTTGAAIDTYQTSYDELGRATIVQELAAGVEKRKTDYTYDRNSNPLSVMAFRPTDATRAGTSRYTAYTWDVRNLVATVRAGDTPTTPAKQDAWAYTYDPRGMLSSLAKPNGNVAKATYHEDGLPKTLEEKTSGGALVASHQLTYTLDGDRSQDVERLDDAGSTGTLDQTSVFAYTPNQQLKTVTRTGADKGENEAFTYDAAGNITAETVGATSTTRTYDRNRLTKSVQTTGGVSTTFNHRYDVLGRASSVDVGAQVVERYGYDGWDRLTRHQRWDSAGTALSSKSSTFDPFDRVVSQTNKPGSDWTVATRFSYLGLGSQVAVEEQADRAGVFKTSKRYAYDPAGKPLSLVDSPITGTTATTSYYGYNPHGDVETLTAADDPATTTTNEAGPTAGTYRYTAYGAPDKVGTTGVDAITGDPTKDADMVNPIRYSGKRFDALTGSYDMGFRTYSTGLNRFLSRDMFNGALDDMNLGSDPWNTNRYAFTGGNPLNRIEVDGHINAIEKGGGSVAPEDGERAQAVAVEHHAKDPVLTAEIGGRPMAAATQESWDRGMEKAKAYLRSRDMPYAVLECGLSTLNHTLSDGQVCSYNYMGYARHAAGIVCKTAGMVCGQAGSETQFMMALGFADGAMFSAQGDVGHQFPGTFRTRGPGSTAKTRAVEDVNALPCNCFAAGTTVQTARGEVPVEQVRTGDQVWAKNIGTGKNELRRVIGLFHKNTTTLMTITVTGGAVVAVTQQHPFMVEGEGWVLSGDLRVGDRLTQRDGGTATITSIRVENRSATVYNFEVEGDHNYYITAAQLLVHNCPTEAGGVSKLTNSQAGDLAKWLGYSKTNFRSSNQPVFRNGKYYITQDIDGHIGGTWKMSRSPDGFSKQDRLGTYDHELNWIGP
ncbi:DNRLRE domain-containing protein [Luteipulveratus flavus]|uniref:DNRLRE domain-containing protein n=1 Tax=Luteipulveratus flavus TaxID=3031728 RepID=A0ABT6CEL9_9MICO|nr:DNRLRE domain-containing protein [Luteipulveratus sp. YIM 133296]MDF8265736.1 DNRLRE domain-containing protein [Luteipulveratus sp. YIM 133296]